MSSAVIHRSLLFVLFALFAALALSAVQCKTNNLDATTNNNYVQQIVGPSGATVNGPDSSQVVIPANALSQDTTIKITALDAPPIPLPAGWTALGKTFAFEPHGQTFSVDVTVTVPYTTASSEAVLVTAEPQDSQWTLITGTSVSPTAITYGTSHFSYFVVVDAGALDSGADATVTDASDAGDAADAVETGPDCAAELAMRLAQPIVPPNKFAGYDLSSGKDPRGLSIDEANDGCLVPADTTVPANPGLRVMDFTPADGGGAAISLSYVIDDRIIALPVLSPGYTGTLSFNSRPGGMYGSYSYQIQIGQPVLRGPLGADAAAMTSFAADWNRGVNDAGMPTASEWANEIFDGLESTFNLGASGTQECLSAQPLSLCLFEEDNGAGGSELGVRSIGFYLVFNQGTNVVSQVYEHYTTATPDCTTPVAKLEAELYSGIGGNGGPSVGGINLSKSMTISQVNAVMCNGVDASAPDPGYGAMQWGDAGQILLEYNATSDIGYKLYANPGYIGTLSGQDPTGDSYSIAVGANGITKNNAAFQAIDWSSAASADPAVTELSNAMQGVNDPDCAAAGDCTITVDDTKGHSVIALNGLQAFVVFQQGTNNVEQIYDIWPGGM